VAEFEKIAKRLPGRKERGTWFRSVPKTRAADILSMQGSLLFGGRYNPQGAFGGLYMSESEDDCKQEILKQVAGNPGALKPRVIVNLKVSLSNVLDLTDEKVQKKLGVGVADLTNPQDRRIPQQVGEAAFRAGFEGIVYPSATTPGAKNLLVFTDNVKGKKIKSGNVRPLKFDQP